MGALLCCFPGFDQQTKVVDRSPAADKKDNYNYKADQKFHKDKFGNLVDDTGARVFSKDYYTYRNLASEHARIRSELFQKSEAAFKAGEKSNAKNLSEEGKEHGKKMEEANRKAVEEIMKNQRDYGSGRLDLHGLTVHEALSVTSEFLETIKKNKRIAVVEVITGQGIHSKDHHAKIKPEVILHLQQKGYKYEEGDHNSGSLKVHLT